MDVGKGREQERKLCRGRGSFETCSECGGAVKIIASIEDPAVITKILTHLNRIIQVQEVACLPESRAPPRASLVESLRDKHETFVFTFRGRPVSHMLNSGWKRARTNVGLTQVRVHDLKHTFGRRY